MQTVLNWSVERSGWGVLIQGLEKQCLNSIVCECLRFYKTCKVLGFGTHARHILLRHDSEGREESNPEWLYSPQATLWDQGRSSLLQLDLPSSKLPFYCHICRYCDTSLGECVLTGVADGQTSSFEIQRQYVVEVSIVSIHTLSPVIYASTEVWDGHKKELRAYWEFLLQGFMGGRLALAIRRCWTSISLHCNE